MPSREWLIERGIGETRAALVEQGDIIEARIELDGTIPAGTVIEARLANSGLGGRNAIAKAAGGAEYLLPRGAPGVNEGASLAIEVTRAAIPGGESWKRPLARITEKPAAALPSLADRLGGRELVCGNARDELREAGWDDLVDEARTGMARFAGGELRISVTPAMTLIDVDGSLPPDELSLAGAREAAMAIRRLDIGGSIGIDLPTGESRAARQSAAQALDELIPRPFERTAVNGFGFVQIVRPRARASLVELSQDRARFEARALLRHAATSGAGPRTLVVHPALLSVFEQQPFWLTALSRQLGGDIGLRANPALPMSGGYAEAS